ncbi:MAG: pseudouridine synthase, partial [bacterium JZ-2024 1]
VLHSYPSVNLSLLELRLETGRTHQIRVHLSAAGYPVLGDPVYGGRKRLRNLPPSVLPLVQLLPGQFLHAAHLSFAHPVSGDLMQFSAPPPQSFDLLHAHLTGKSAPVTR